jgi:ketosteroid isomerase-like protein
MSNDEQQIRDLIETWVAAVDAGDEAGAIADRTEDIVMFDVPGPAAAASGMDEYRRTWPEFLEYQRGKAVFQLVSLDVTAGGEVAFANALLRCGPLPMADDPERRLRLTLGLRKEGGRWLVSHEHHSFADMTSVDAERADTELRAIHDRWSADTEAKDLDGLMEPIAEDVVSYEHEPPLVYRGAAEVRAACERGLDAGPDASFDIPDLEIVASGDLAVAWGLNRTLASVGGAAEETWSRGSRVFRRDEAGRWRLVHQHVSFPFDPETGQACTDLRP